MRLTFSGPLRPVYGGGRVRLTWEDGRLEGDPVLVATVEDLVRGLVRAGERVTYPGGGAWTADSWEEPLAMYALARGHLFVAEELEVLEHDRPLEPRDLEGPIE